MKVDSAAIRSRYKSEETESLVRIVNFESHNYLPEAVEAARLELQERGVNTSESEVVADVAASIEAEEKESLALATLPLNPILKLICFVFCDVFSVIIALSHSASGKKLAARQAWIWFGYGWLFRVSILFTFFVATR